MIGVFVFWAVIAVGLLDGRTVAQRVTGSCPYCGSPRATLDDDVLVCEGCGATFPVLGEDDE